MARLTPRFQFIDSTGAPLTGGTLTTYAEGSTTTYKSTYPTAKDLEKRTNPNPTIITLNDKGRSPVDMFLNGAYNFVLKDSLGNTVYSTDNLNTADSYRDSNGKPYFSTGTAVGPNGIEIQNAKAGQPVIIKSIGTADNVDLTFQTKGSGAITLAEDVTVSGVLRVGSISPSGDAYSIPATATSSSKLALGEDSDNGTNTITIQAPSSLTNTSVLTLTDGFSTSGYLGLSGNTLTITSALSAGTTAGIRQIKTCSLNVAPGFNATYVIPYDTTTPQNSEGYGLPTSTGYNSITITPVSSSSTLLFFGTIDLFQSSYESVTSSDQVLTLAMFKDNATSAVAAAAQHLLPQNGTYAFGAKPCSLPFLYSETSGSTTQRVYTFRVGMSVSNGTRYFSQGASSYMWCIEIDGA